VIHNIKRFSVHQNAKMMAVMSLALSLIFVLPFLLLASFAGPGRGGFPFWLVIVMPVVYLVMTYIMMAIMGWIYNMLAPKIGGLEFETTD
jgi:uncharacterized membrane protein YhdT